MGVSAARKIVGVLAAAVLLASCSSGPSSTARDDGDPQELLAAFEGLDPEEIVRAGDAAAANGESERALFIYNQALLLDESAATWHRIGEVYWQLGQNAQAWRAFANSLQKDPDYAKAHEEIGLLHLAMKQQEPAKAHLKRAIELDPASWRAQNALGVLADVEKDYISAINYYNAALEANPDSAMLLNNLGYSYYLAGNLAQAEAHLRIAVGLDPDYKPAVANLGLSHARRGDYDEAVEILRGVVEQSQAYNDVGFIAYHNGDLEDAAWLLTEAIRISPRYYETARQNLRRVRQAIAKAKDENSTDAVASSPTGEDLGDAQAIKSAAQPEIRSVTANELNVRTAASQSAPVVVALRQGEEVQVSYEVNGWAFVEFWRQGGDGRQAGWVSARYLEAQVPDSAETDQTVIEDDAAAAVVAP